MHVKYSDEQYFRLVKNTRLLVRTLHDQIRSDAINFPTIQNHFTIYIKKNVIFNIDNAEGLSLIQY